MRGNGRASEETFQRKVTKITELLAEKHKLFSWENQKWEIFCRCSDGKREHAWNTCVKHFCRRVERTLIPLRRAVKMNFDDLPGIGDVVPVAVGLPAFGDNLDEDASHGRFGNVRDALHVGLDVDFSLFVFD